MADLATGKRNNRVPYGELKKDTTGFVTKGSVPAGLIIQEPRNMQRLTIQSILRNWYERQQESGPESAFGFELVIGPKRKRLFAAYPPKISGNKSSQQAKKKGKQKDVQQLDDLLPISQIGTPDPTGIPITGPSEGHGNRAGHHLGGIPSGSTYREQQVHDEVSESRGSRSDDLVRIDMGQMVLLRRMGHEVLGPVNGPNEGLPQYEVPRLWLEELQKTISNPKPTPNPAPITTSTRPYPRPRPIKKTAPPQTVPLIDPALVGQMPMTSATEQLDHCEDNVGSESGPDPMEPGPNVSAPTTLGKRNAVLRSPISMRQTRSKQKRKIVTGDDLAMQEAQKLLKGGIRTRRTRKRH